jgi:hypothetical protein
MVNNDEEGKIGTAPVFLIPSLLNGEAGDALQSTYHPPCFSPCPSLFLALYSSHQNPKVDFFNPHF